MNRSQNKFTMWKENRTDKEHSMTFIDILTAFVKSEFFDRFNEGLNFDRALRLFITDPKGLNSSSEQDDYDTLADFVYTYHHCIERDRPPEPCGCDRDAGLLCYKHNEEMMKDIGVSE